jgi:hypothetical protein
MLHEVNDRFLLVLVNDQMNKARGLDSSMKYKEFAHHAARGQRSLPPRFSQ